LRLANQVVQADSRRAEGGGLRLSMGADAGRVAARRRAPARRVGDDSVELGGDG
jgi:hypothetical protein